MEAGAVQPGVAATTVNTSSIVPGDRTIGR